MSLTDGAGIAVTWGVIAGALGFVAGLVFRDVFQWDVDPLYWSALTAAAVTLMIFAWFLSVFV